jgi:hypothetical protein
MYKCSKQNPTDLALDLKAKIEISHGFGGSRRIKSK